MPVTTTGCRFGRFVGRRMTAYLKSAHFLSNERFNLQ